MKSYHKSIIPIFLFLFIFVIYYASPMLGVSDSVCSILTSISIIKEGNFDLNEYTPLLEYKNWQAVEKINGKYYNYFPHGVSIVSLPMVFILLKIFGSTGLILGSESVESICGSTYTALTGVIIFYIGRYLGLLTITRSIVLALIFSFCTCAYSVTSKLLWMHGPSMFFLIFTFFLLIIGKTKEHIIQYASIPLAISYIIRPTNSISIVIFSLYILIYHRKYFLKFSLYGIIIASFFFLNNFYIYGSILPTYFRGNRLVFNFDLFFTALLGNLISPSRGLFFWSPFFLFIFIGVYLKVKEKNLEPIEKLLLVLISLHWIFISLFPHWWAGHSIGYRFFSDMIPFLMIFIIPVMKNIFRPKKKLLTVCFMVSIFLSFYFHYRAANNSEVQSWNNIPNDIDLNPDRLWDWKDPQSLRGDKISRLLGKYIFAVGSAPNK